jgi:hypothetical protein
MTNSPLKIKHWAPKIRKSKIRSTRLKGGRENN